MAGIMVIKVQQLKKTSFDRILAFSAEGSDNRRSQDSSLLSILLEEMGLLDMVYILKRVWGKGKWLSPEGGPCPDQFWRSPELSLSLCPSHIASSIDKIINKSSMLQIEKFSEKCLLDNEWIIIFQFE